LFQPENIAIFDHSLALKIQLCPDFNQLPPMNEGEKAKKPLKTANNQEIG